MAALCTLCPVLQCRVAHLAKELLRSLCENAKEYKGELAITDRDQFCIQIAALCHDLGKKGVSKQVLCQVVQPAPPPLFKSCKEWVELLSSFVATS